MERRPILIAVGLTALILALLTAETLREKLDVAPMPPEMQCVVQRNCSTPDFAGPPPPPAAPPSSDVRPIEPKTRHHSVR